VAAKQRRIEEISSAEVPSHSESTNPGGKHYGNVAKSTAHFGAFHFSGLFRIYA